MNQNKNSKGFTLIELMISVALGIILTAGVIEIYTGSKQTYRTQEAMSRLQENARFAIEILTRDIRNSGFIGCSRISDTNIQSETITGFAGLEYNEAMAAWGYQASGSDGLNLDGGGHSMAAITGALDTASERTPYSDVLVLQGATGCSVDVSSDMTSIVGGNSEPDPEANVTISSNACRFNQDDYVLISNCGTADVFQISTAISSDNQLSHSSALSMAYTNDGFTEVFPFFSKTYFIRPDANDIPSLFVVDNTEGADFPNLAVALVEGVESMQIQYGIDVPNVDGAVNRYSNANEVIDNTTPETATDWSDVSAIRITLLLRTTEDLGAQAPLPEAEAEAEDFTVAGDAVPNLEAGPIRQQFVSTIQLRNRG